jgi:CDP-paratose 2-epimerase
LALIVRLHFLCRADNLAAQLAVQGSCDSAFSLSQTCCFFRGLELVRAGCENWALNGAPTFIRLLQCFGVRVTALARGLMRLLITGSNGLIGSELTAYFDAMGGTVIGLDNNMRADFFGRDGDTLWNLRRLKETLSRYRHFDQDIRDRASLKRLFNEEGPFDLIVHCAAQPSHDLAASRSWDDFDVNAVGTLNLLETTRQISPEAVFIFMSTNKVYGDAPNELPLVEMPLRYDFANREHYRGISEAMRVDQSKHSVFGASKLAADVMTQEYGRYFGMKTTCLRAGCMTGPNHSAVELHGFLSYLVKAQLTGKLYRVFGYKGKQVRDNIHSYDVARAVEVIYRNPGCGKVYNIGGGRDNACSILEAFECVEAITGKPMQYDYIDKPREGDHICYITDFSALRSDYPDWNITLSLQEILHQIAISMNERADLAELRTGL